MTGDFDPRLVDLYDEDNPDGPDHEFYRRLADELSAGAIVDLGCGTGLLTVTLWRLGRRVVGIDPSTTMLAYARSRVGADQVQWIRADSRGIPAMPFDYAVMAGNVAQHLDDATWDRTLVDLHAALRPGGTLAFESRNPQARAWEAWSTQRSVRETPHGPLTEWSVATEVAPGRVELLAHNMFGDDAETLSYSQTLAFRERAGIEGQLDAAGFDVAAVYGDWTRGPLEPDSAVMVFVARAR